MITKFNALFNLGAVDPYNTYHVGVLRQMNMPTGKFGKFVKTPAFGNVSIGLQPMGPILLSKPKV